MCISLKNVGILVSQANFSFTKKLPILLLPYLKTLLKILKGFETERDGEREKEVNF